MPETPRCGAETKTTGGFKWRAVYVLVDPRTRLVRYVGQTKDPEDRLRRHCSSGSNQGQTHRESWLSDLLGSGYRPEMYVLGWYRDGEWQRAERGWIRRLGGVHGADLTNGNPGGRSVGQVEGRDERYHDSTGFMLRRHQFSHAGDILRSMRNTAHERWGVDRGRDRLNEVLRNWQPYRAQRLASRAGRDEEGWPDAATHLLRRMSESVRFDHV